MPCARGQGWWAAPPGPAPSITPWCGVTSPLSLHHTLVWGEVPSVMVSSGGGTLSCHSQGRANQPPSFGLLDLTPCFELPCDLRTFPLQIPDLHSQRKACT